MTPTKQIWTARAMQLALYLLIALLLFVVVWAAERYITHEREVWLHPFTRIQDRRANVGYWASSRQGQYRIRCEDIRAHIEGLEDSLRELKRLHNQLSDEIDADMARVEERQRSIGKDQREVERRNR